MREQVDLSQEFEMLQFMDAGNYNLMEYFDMPNGYGIPTSEEVTHYKKVLDKFAEAVRIRSVSPLDEEKFDRIVTVLEQILKEYDNDFLKNNSSEIKPLTQVDRLLRDHRNSHDLHTKKMFQDEILRGEEKYKELLEASQNNPHRDLVKSIINKSNEDE